MQKNNKAEIELVDLIFADIDKFLLFCTSIKQASKYLEASILYKDGCLEALSTIAREGKLDSDRIRAIKILSKIEGWEVPTKQVSPAEASLFIKEMTKLIQRIN